MQAFSRWVSSPLSRALKYRVSHCDRAGSTFPAQHVRSAEQFAPIPAQYFPEYAVQPGSSGNDPLDEALPPKPKPVLAQQL